MGEGVEALLQRIQVAFGIFEHQAHEEAACFGIAKLLRFDDVAALCGEVIGHRRHDASAVRTGECQDELAGNDHGVRSMACDEG